MATCDSFLNIPIKKIRVEGIRLSDELVQVNLRNPSGSNASTSRICRLLAANQINVPFLSMTNMDGRLVLSFCVASDDSPRVKALLQRESTLTKYLEFIPAVGQLSLFPHHYSLRVLGLSLGAFGKARLPIYGLASSISALTFITDYVHLDRGVDALKEYLDFPPNFAPYRPEIRMRQSKLIKEH